MTAVVSDRPPRSARHHIFDGFSLEVGARDAGKLGLIDDVLPARSIVSIPFLPVEDNGTRVAAARAVREQGFEPMPHIAARRLASHEELERFLANLAEQAQVQRLLVLAGDPAKPLGPFPDSATLLKSGLAEKYGIRHVAVAGHPEAHGHLDKAGLVAAMRLKQSILNTAGLDWSIVTQFAFSADPVLTWVEDVRNNGFEVPIHIGVPGPASVKTLLRFAAICGVGASTSVLRKYGLSVTQLLSNVGPNRLVDRYRQTIDVRRHGEIRLHFYPFGGLTKSADWIRVYSAGA